MTIVIIILIIIVIFAAIYNTKQKHKENRSPEKKYISIDDQFMNRKRDREKEIDRLLSKMGKNGVNDLSPKEQQRLNELSKK